MLVFFKNRRYRKYIYSLPVTIFILVLVSLLAVEVFERFVAAQEMKEEYAKSKTKLQELKERADFLDEQVGELKSERGIEERLRRNFYVIKEGEQMVVITGEE